MRNTQGFVIDYNFMLKYGCTSACIKGWCEANFSRKWEDCTAEIIADAIGVSSHTVRKTINVLIADGFLERQIESITENGTVGTQGCRSYYRLGAK